MENTAPCRKNKNYIRLINYALTIPHARKTCLQVSCLQGYCQCHQTKDDIPKMHYL